MAPTAALAGAVACWRFRARSRRRRRWLRKRPGPPPPPRGVFSHHHGGVTRGPRKPCPHPTWSEPFAELLGAAPGLRRRGLIANFGLRFPSGPSFRWFRCAMGRAARPAMRKNIFDQPLRAVLAGRPTCSRLPRAPRPLACPPRDCPLRPVGTGTSRMVQPRHRPVGLGQELSGPSFANPRRSERHVCRAHRRGLRRMRMSPRPAAKSRHHAKRPQSPPIAETDWARSGKAQAPSARDGR